MRLHPDACEYYRLAITTEPDVPAASWEASFDDGETWKAATPLDSDAGWLLAGPGYSGDTLDPIRLTGSVQPLVRLLDSPETVIRTEGVPTITVGRPPY